MIKKKKKNENNDEPYKLGPPAIARPKQHEPAKSVPQLGGWDVALQASRSAPRARISHIDTIAIIPSITYGNCTIH